MTLREDAEGIHRDLVQLRREPEIGGQLPLTQAKPLAALDGLPLQVSTGTALSSVTGVLRGARSGPAVLLRCDMDALTVRELIAAGGGGADWEQRVALNGAEPLGPAVNLSV